MQKKFIKIKKLNLSTLTTIFDVQYKFVNPKMSLNNNVVILEQISFNESVHNIYISAMIQAHSRCVRKKFVEIVDTDMNLSIGYRGSHDS